MPCYEKKPQFEAYIMMPDGRRVRVTEANLVPTFETKTITCSVSISDVKVINNKVVIVYFSDGTKTKAVCDKDDTFSLEVGIGICIAKRIMSADEHTGNQKYNNAIRYALKVMKRNEELAKAAEEIEEEEKRIEAKIQRKKQRRAEKRRERRINEMTEAIKRAGVCLSIDDLK